MNHDDVDHDDDGDDDVDHDDDYDDDDHDDDDHDDVDHDDDNNVQPFAAVAEKQFRTHRCSLLLGAQGVLIIIGFMIWCNEQYFHTWSIVFHGYDQHIVCMINIDHSYE